MKIEPEDYDDCDDMPSHSCPKCMRDYDDVDYEYQSCSKCGWDEENKKWTKPRKPTQDDYLSGDADILTGRWY